MIYSYSSLSCYLNCPQQFYRKYKAKDVLPFTGKEAKSGTEVHEAIEKALKTRQPLPLDMQDYETHIQGVRDKLDMARIEQTIYLNENFSTVLVAPKKGFIAKLDVLLLSPDGTRAVVMDWKTGKPREHTLQHDCYALAVLKAFPRVEHLTGFNVYLKTGQIGNQLHYVREGIGVVQESIARIIARIESDERWAPNPSPLCHWCGADKCQYYPKELA